ncbi:MAG: class I SAM-dependent RNA methyltransferase [Lewinellaceae bacterium]|nr:class I SAM-dependent RNA methyltransferase [Lewinellaceae bacterium]
MQVFDSPSRIIVTCYGRLSPYLQQEITALGYKIVRPFATGVELYGSVKDCIRLNLRLRCASQVLYSLREFRCNHPDELYRALLPIPWEELISPTGYFSVTSNVYHPTINNSMFANVKVKDAIVDRLRRETGKRPSTGAELKGAVIYLYWKDRSAEIFLDTSGETLAKHGYRKLPGTAPMLESLAAATILASQWDRRSPFVNPMCGAGTLAIEAALIATDRFPGLLRDNYAFMHLTGFQRSMYTRERALLDGEIKDVPGLKIIATDNAPEAIQRSKINATAAGVEPLIEFDLCDFAATELPADGNGVVFFNPEYGERMGEVAELEKTYSQLGDFMKQKCGGYKGYIFTGNLELAKKIGLKARRRIEFYNGKLDCRLLEFELYAGSRRQKTDTPE